MKSFKNIILLFLIVASIYAETIDGPANIRKEPNGKLIAIINNNEYVNAMAKNDKWQIIELECYIPQETINNDIYNENYSVYEVKKDATILNKNGDSIGKIFKTADFYKECDTLNKYKGILLGYTNAKNINVNSILENQIDSIFKKGGTIYKDFKDHIILNEYYKWKDTNNWELFNKHIPETPASPDLRIMMAFYNDSLIAYISRNRIRYNNFEIKEYVGESKRYPIHFFTNDSIKINNFKNNFYNTIKYAD